MAIIAVGDARPASTLNFPQGTVIDGLSNVITAGNSTKINFPRSGAPPSRSSNKVTHDQTLGYGFVNEVGRDGFQGKPFTFPVGTVIVRDRRWMANSNPDRLVVMIKREPAFNRKANGWEFLTVNGEATKVLKREKGGACLKCHRDAAANDFVFPMEKR